MLSVSSKDENEQYQQASGAEYFIGFVTEATCYGKPHVGNIKRPRAKTRQGQTALHWAVTIGDLPAVAALLRISEYTWPGYIDFRNPISNHAAVHLAATYGHTYILYMLASCGCSMSDQATYTGQGTKTSSRAGLGKSWGECLRRSDVPVVMNALVFAISNGHEESAEYLLAYHDEEEARREAFTLSFLYTPAVVQPLALAAYTGMVNVAATLISKGADVNSICDPIGGSTPLMSAASRPDNAQMINLLLEHGADGNATCHARGYGSLNALGWACQVDSVENIAALSSHGYCHVKGYGRFLEITHQCLCVFLCDDRFLDTTSDITQLLASGSLRWLDRHWAAAIRHAFTRASQKNAKTLKFLIETNMCLGLDFEGPDPKLHFVGVFGSRPQVRKQDYIDGLWQRTGITALHCAAKSSDMPFELLKMLVEERACDINVPHEGETPAAAILCRRPWNQDMADLLFKHGADPSACGRSRQRAVLYAAQKGSSREEIEQCLEALEEEKRKEKRKEQRKKRKAAQNKVRGRGRGLLRQYYRARRFPAWFTADLTWHSDDKIDS